MPCLFGQWQYFYENEKGVIDAVLLPNYFSDGIDLWEIWSNEKLFEDVERFDTLEEAEERIKELLKYERPNNDWDGSVEDEDIYREKEEIK